MHSDGVLRIACRTRTVRDRMTVGQSEDRNGAH